MRTSARVLLVIGVAAGAVAAAGPAAACVPHAGPPTLVVVTPDGGLRPVIEVRRPGLRGLGGQLRLREVLETCAQTGVCVGPELDLEITRPARRVGFDVALVRPRAPLVDGATYELSLIAGAGPTAARTVVGRVTIAAVAQRPPAPAASVAVVAVAHRPAPPGACLGASWAIELAVRDWDVAGAALRGRTLAISLTAPTPAQPQGVPQALVPLTGPAVRVTVDALALPGGARPTRLWATVIDGDGADGPPVELALP